jgi:transposase
MSTTPNPKKRAKAQKPVRGTRVRAGSRGTYKRLSEEQLDILGRLILAGMKDPTGPQWTLEKIRAVIAKEFGVRYSVPGVWKLLRDLKWLVPKSRGKPKT